MAQEPSRLQKLGRQKMPGWVALKVPPRLPKLAECNAPVGAIRSHVECHIVDSSIGVDAAQRAMQEYQQAEHRRQAKMQKLLGSRDALKHRIHNHIQRQAVALQEIDSKQKQQQAKQERLQRFNQHVEELKVVNMAFANMMNAPAPAASAGCLHNSPAAVLHARSAPHCHRRPTKDFRVQAVAETETRAPATSNGSTPKDGVPPGTPVVETLDLPSRPRRNRRSPTIRHAFSETHLSPSNLILPVFVHDGEKNSPIASMPGVDRLGWRHGLIDAVQEARSFGVNQVVIFPKTPENLKTELGEESFNPDGLAQRSIKLLKDTFPDIEVYTDVALDPYSSDGHDGIVSDAGVIMNDETVEFLCRQAVSQARAGADVVSPSDMMDGRVGAIRKALDREGFSHVSIMAYTAKYASAFYGPFREALASAPKPGQEGRIIPPNKKTYQQDPANYREALREARLDEAEGADIMMVKPGMPYLDIIRLLRDNTTLPVAAYHVSGEYAMLKAAALNGWLNEEEAVLEALLGMRRAGAELILSYYATDAAKWMNK